MSNDLIDKRDKRTRQRKEKKRKMDSLISLSKENEEKNVKTLSASVAVISDTDQTARLIDEGFCDNGFVLKKGALEKYLNGKNEYVTGWEMKDGSWQRTEVLNLTDDFVGTVNLGHKDFATDPYILGEFKKSDLTLVDIENDRKALDIAVRLDEESMFVKELRRQPYDIGVSAEFYYHIDWEATESLMADYGMYIPVFDEIFIFAYGLVGECGNVNSSGLELKGVTMKDETNITEQVSETAEENIEELIGEAEVEIEPTIGTVEDEPTTEEPKAEENSEEGTTEETEDGDEGETDEADELTEVLSVLKGLNDKVAALSKELKALEETNASLKKTNRKLSGKLQKELDKKEQFKAAAKGVAAELLPEETVETEEPKVTKRSRDGIGEI